MNRLQLEAVIFEDVVEEEDGHVRYRVFVVGCSEQWVVQRVKKCVHDERVRVFTARVVRAHSLERLLSAVIQTKHSNKIGFQGNFGADGYQDT